MPHKDKQKRKEYRLTHREETKKCKAKHYLAYKEKLKELSARYQIEHKEEIKANKAKYYLEHRDELKESSAKNRLTHKQERKGYEAKYREKHKQEAKEYQARYYLNHKEEHSAYQNEYKKQRILIDPLYKMKNNLRCRTCHAFTNMSLNKLTKTEKLLGADWKTVMRHIESQFIFGMTWKNYGEWHIDHKKPLALAKTEKQLIRLCRYTNLQPLWKEENLRKNKRTDYVVKEVRFG